MKNKQIGRLAMRVEGSLWVAYIAARAAIVQKEGD